MLSYLNKQVRLKSSVPALHLEAGEMGAVIEEVTLEDSRIIRTVEFDTLTSVFSPSSFELLFEIVEGSEPPSR